MRRTAEINKSGSIKKFDFSTKKSAGKIGTARARAQPELDATALLTDDHGRIKGLFAQFEKAQDDWKIALFEAIKSELRAHTKVEEDIFYPALSELGSRRATEDIQQSRKDHQLVDEILNELERLTPADRYFGIKMMELMEEVMSQIKFEKEEVFKLARTELGEEKLNEVGTRIKRFKESENPTVDSPQQPASSFQFLPVRGSNSVRK
jgi:hemerythrin-like domain-containing protein